MPKTKKAPAAELEPKPKPQTIIPRTRWVVIRRDWRTGESRHIATFTSPSYAQIFKRALGDMSDVNFQIREVIKK